MQRFGCSERKALHVVKMSASLYRYESRKRDESALKLRVKEITQTRVHYGYRRVHVMLRREGHKDNVKRVYRLYREEGLSLRLKRPRRNRAAKLRQPKHLAWAINEIWSMDFVADALFDGRKLRMLTVVDCYTRECLAIDVGQSLKGEDVVDSLNRICGQRGLPKTTKTDNGSEFISKVMDKWAIPASPNPANEPAGALAKRMASPSIRWETNYATRLRRRASSRASSSLSASGSCSPPE